MEVEAADEGIVKKILFKEGTQSIKVNTPIVIIDDGSLSNTTQDVEKKSDKKVINQKILFNFNFYLYIHRAFCS